MRIWSTLRPNVPPDTTAVHIIFYNGSRNKQFGIRLPEWGGGGALGQDSIIIPVGKKPLLKMDVVQTTIHELAHIVINRAFGQLRVPRWIHEGSAMVLSGEMMLDGQRALSRAIWTGKLMSLESIENVNRFDRSRANLAYAQSHATILFLITTYGVDGLAELLEEGGKSRNFAGACQTTYGLSPKEIEELALQYITQRFRLAFLTDDHLIWALITLLALAAIAVSQFRRRRRLNEMEVEERENEELRIRN